MTTSSLLRFVCKSTPNQRSFLYVISKSTSRTQRSFSEAVLPTRHSRHEPPEVCIDSVERNERTLALLEATQGSLFTYGNRKEDESSPFETAWETADHMRQETEYLLRGYASCVPGSLYFTKEQEGEYDETTLPLMNDLMDRVLEEGIAYMGLRNEALQPKEIQTISEETTNKTQANSDSESSSSSDSDSSSDSEDEANNFCDDFASPGLTTAMYDVLLDSMASVAATDAFITVENTNHLWKEVLWRHSLNPELLMAQAYTQPTLITYNATIRIAATLPIENDEKRDQALLLAYTVFDDMFHSSIVDPNTATFIYLLQATARSLPTSRAKGNTLHGIWLHAQEDGLIDDNLNQAYRIANTPSNGSEFDDWMDQNLNKIPNAWKRNVQRRYYDSRSNRY